MATGLARDRSIPTSTGIESWPDGTEQAPLLGAGLSSETQGIYAANTEEAIRRSVFGSPTYFVDGDMFFGQDRLELVERALVKPFAGTWPRQ